MWGISKVMRAYVESGQARYDEWSHLAIGMRFRAGAMGVPFMPMRPMLGSDVLASRPEARVIDCPFTGEKILLVPALNPDIAIIHVHSCDPYGNARIEGLQFMDIDLAMAADKVILTTERIISDDQIRREGGTIGALWLSRESFRLRRTINAARNARIWFSAARRFCCCCNGDMSISASWVAHRSTNTAL
jgi:acyl CoA:acetate/3-ketoacid CoA transferase alpha subunit